MRGPPGVLEHPRAEVRGVVAGPGPDDPDPTDTVQPLCGRVHLLPDAEGVLSSMRPEKLRFVPSGQGRMDATVRERFFLGSQWLYRVDSALGELVIVCANDGAPALQEGQRSGIDWADAALRPLAGEAARLQPSL